MLEAVDKESREGECLIFKEIKPSRQPPGITGYFRKSSFSYMLHEWDNLDEQLKIINSDFKKILLLFFKSKICDRLSEKKFKYNFSDCLHRFTLAALTLRKAPLLWRLPSFLIRKVIRYVQTLVTNIKIINVK